MCWLMFCGARLKRMPNTVIAMSVRPATTAMPAAGIWMPKISMRRARASLTGSFQPKSFRVVSACVVPVCFLVVMFSSSGGPESQQWTEEAHETFPGFLLPGTVRPLLVGDAPRALEVVFEVGDLAEREVAVVDVEVGLVVQPERAGVEVGGTHGRPQAVDHQHLAVIRSEEHTSELQSPDHLVCRLLLEKKKKKRHTLTTFTACKRMVVTRAA